MTGQFTQAQGKKSGQSSVEMVLVVSITVVLCFLVVTRFTNVQESVFISASARQAIISDIEGMDSNVYHVRTVQTVSCPGEMRVNVEITPKPGPNNAAAIAQKVENAMRSTVNIRGSVSVAFNEPEQLVC